MRHKTRVTLLALALAGCTNSPIQLASPYDAAIDTQAQALETDFLTFAAERQQNSGSDAGMYSNYAKAYDGFNARLAVMTLRAASDPGGTSCGEALKIAGRVQTGPLMSSALTAGKVDASATQSCISLEVAQVQQAFALLQQADQERCASAATSGLCATLFPAGSISDFMPAVNSGKAPLVRALVVALESLVGFEQDIKPASKG